MSRVSRRHKACGHLGGWDLPEGPIQHLAMSGSGAGIRERLVLGEMWGPNIHLVDDSHQHLEEVAKMGRAR